MKISFYQKKEPLIIEKMVRTTIFKNNALEKMECKKLINKQFLPTSRYKINEKMKDCESKKMK